MKEIETRLLEIKEQIEEAAAEVQKLEGRIGGLMENLEKEFECKTVSEAEKKITALEKEISEKEKALQQLLTKIEEEYEFE